MAHLLTKWKGKNYICVPFRDAGRISQADVAQLVERNLAKVKVASSSLVIRSKPSTRLVAFFFAMKSAARVVELVDTQDLKSCGQ